jgi:hypothetical protein
MKILFDPMGAQVQVQQSTGDRLTTWFDSLTTLGCDYTIGDFTPLDKQLEGTDVYVSLTRQQSGPALPPGGCFSYTPNQLYRLQQWVKKGGSILMFTNHSGYPEAASNQEPTWPIFEIQLAASLGIQLVFASFVGTGSSPTVPNSCSPRKVSTTLSMGPGDGAPTELVDGVSAVQAWDSGGIVTGKGTAVIALPPAADCTDKSGLDYCPDPCSFAALYTFGAGRVIVVGHSGIVGNDGTCAPSAGQIGAADNLRFLNNCITYLGS